MVEIEMGQNLKALNDAVAQMNRSGFQKHRVFVLDMMGSPGSGKTTLLENILPALAKKQRIFVIEGDLATQNDAERIRKTGVGAVQINTNGACHLDARMIQNEIEQLDLRTIDLLIIENVGNLVCPISYDLGEDLRLVILSTPEGEDKPLKYPPAMLHTDAVVITKTDLAPYVDVNIDTMKTYIHQINPKVQILEVGKFNGIYAVNEVISYLEEKIAARKG
ncbi:MAG: hydrogenase nickel incorporation protein HypB [Negativicutes bacterium]|nr:hydrogenase nickel incorporation protein HypB [Negativicutes bacterium]